MVEGRHPRTHQYTPADGAGEGRSAGALPAGTRARRPQECSAVRAQLTHPGALHPQHSVPERIQPSLSGQGVCVCVCLAFSD